MRECVIMNLILLVDIFQLVILALRWLLKSLNDDEKFHQAEEECLKWLRWDALPPDNPKRRGGYH